MNKTTCCRILLGDANLHTHVLNFGSKVRRCFFSADLPSDLIMKQASVRLHFLLLLLLIFHPATSADLQEVDKVPVEVITDSSPCSTTCGLGVKTQTLCFLKDGKTAMEENVRREDGTKVATSNTTGLRNAKKRKVHH